MVTISKSHEIEDDSKTFLKELLQLKHFILRPLIPDYHVDYLVELVENKSPSGILFGIQLKGVESLNNKNNNIKFSLKSKHLSYYLDNIKSFPIYLIIVDTTNKKAYWLFLQKYLKEEILNKYWRNQRNVSIYIKTESVINNIEKFKKNIIEANNYMKELWPSSLYASAKKEREYLKSLDPRVKDISISMKESSVNYQFHTDENIELKLEIKDGKKLQDFLTNPVSQKLILKKDEVEIIGSELFKEILNRSNNIEYQVQRHPVNLDVYMLIEDKVNTFSEVIHFNGVLTFVNENINIDCFISDSPLTLQIIMDSQDRKKPTFNLNFDFNKWLRKPIQFLPHLNNLYNFFSKAKNSKDVIMKIDYLGNNYAYAQFNFEGNNDFIDWIYNGLTVIKKLQTVNSYYNLKLLFPDLNKLTKDIIHYIEMLHDLIVTGEHIEKNKSMTFRANIKNEPKLIETIQKNVEMRIESNLKISFLDREVNIGLIAIDFINPKFLTNEKELDELLKSDKEYIPLKFSTDKNTIITYRLLKEKTLASQ